MTRIQIKWCSMKRMAKLSDLPIPKYVQLTNSRFLIIGDYCIASIDHINNILSLNIINRRMPHPQIELFFTYFHEGLHILNWNLLRRQIINNWIDWIECNIFQRSIYKLWRRMINEKEVSQHDY